MRVTLRFWIPCALLAACGSVPEQGQDPAPVDRVERVELPRGEWTGEVRVPAGEERLSPEEEQIVTAAVAKLDSKDFAVYSSAASLLAGMGEAVVPYLGYVGDPGSPGDRTFSIITVVLTPILYATPPERVGAHLSSPYRAVRAAAAATMGERHLMDNAADLVDLLEDPDKQVRRAAIRALRVLYNRFFGYNPGAAHDDRADAVAKWRQFVGGG